MSDAFFDISWEGPTLDKKTLRIIDSNPKSKLTLCYPTVGQFLNTASQECFELRSAINPDDGILTTNFRANRTGQLQALRRCRPKNREELHHPLHWRAGLRLQGLKVPPSHPGLHAPGW
jgi:hypothetical protein